MPWERIQEQEAETDLVTGTEARNERTKKTDTEKFKQYFLDGMAHESFLGTKPIPKCSDHISLTHLADTPPTTITWQWRGEIIYSLSSRYKNGKILLSFNGALHIPR